MEYGDVEIVRVATDIAVIGGGTAGCFAAITIKETNPSIDVIVVEKAHVKRAAVWRQVSMPLMPTSIRVKRRIHTLSMLKTILPA